MRIVLIVDDVEGVVDVAPYRRGFKETRGCAQMLTDLDTEIKEFHEAIVSKQQAKSKLVPLVATGT